MNNGHFLYLDIFQLFFPRSLCVSAKLLSVLLEMLPPLRSSLQSTGGDAYQA